MPIAIMPLCHYAILPIRHSRLYPPPPRARCPNCQAKGWALDLSGGEMLAEAGFSYFGVNVGVTPEGLEHVDEIIDIVFQYVRMLQTVGPQVRSLNLCARRSFSNRTLLPCTLPALVATFLWHAPHTVCMPLTALTCPVFSFRNCRSGCSTRCPLSPTRLSASCPSSRPCRFAPTSPRTC